MPRTLIEPQFTVEHLSILDSDGNLDTALEPELAADDLKRLYRAMLLGRRLDERMLRLQRQGRIGTFAPIKGQEAAQIGSVCTLRPTDWMVPSFRETAAMLWRGWPIEKILLFFAGHLEGGQPGPEQHDLPISHPGRHPAPARGRPRLRRPVPRRRRGGHGVLRRRRDLRGRLPRGDELRGRLARADGVRRARTTSGRSRSRSRSRPTRAPSPRRRSPTASPASRWTATTCSRSTRRRREAVERARARRGADPDRVRDVSAGRAHHRGRPDQVPLDGRGRRRGSGRIRSPASAPICRSAISSRPGSRSGRRRRSRGPSPPSRRRRRPTRSPCSTTPTPSGPPALEAQRAEMQARLAPAPDGAGAGRARRRPRRGADGPMRRARARRCGDRGAVAKLNMVKALNLALLQEMERDPDVLVIGEDVGVDGGVFRVTEDLHRKFGGTRVMDSPLAEAGIIGASVGMALYGLKPVCEIQFSGFAFQCFHQIENHVARYRMRTPGPLRLPDGGAHALRRRGARARAPLGERGAVLRPHPRAQDGDPLRARATRAPCWPRRSAIPTR